MNKFNHRGEQCLYIELKEGYILIMVDSYSEPYEFYYIPLIEWRTNSYDWRRHLSEKNWGSQDLINEIDRKIGILFGKKDGKTAIRQHTFLG